MAVGAVAAGAYGVPRSTRDVDLLVSVKLQGGIAAVISKLDPVVQFDSKVLFDTLTGGRRHVGQSRSAPPFKVELFETFDDPFVESELARRQQVFIPVLGRTTWLPSPEDVVVQKLRWGRPKDLDVRAGLPMPGVFEVGERLSIREAIEDLLLIAECSR